MGYRDATWLDYFLEALSFAVVGASVVIMLIVLLGGGAIVADLINIP